MPLPNKRLNKIIKRRRKVCVFCADKFVPDYKEYSKLKKLTSDRGKILSRRVTGVCYKHQRRVAEAIKRARHLALLPFVSD